MIAPTVAYVLVVAFALWVGSGTNPAEPRAAFRRVGPVAVASPGVQFNDDIRARLQARVRGDRLEAPGAPLPLGSVEVVDQGEEPVGPRGPEVSRGGVVKCRLGVGDPGRL